MISNEWVIGILIACCIVSIISLIIGSVSLIFVWAIKMSTHKIEWRDPFPEENAESGFMSLKEMNERMKKEQEDIDRDFV